MRRIYLLATTLAAFFIPFASLRLATVFFTLSDSFFIAAGAALALHLLFEKGAVRGQDNLSGLRKTWLMGSLMVTVGLLLSELFLVKDSGNWISEILQYNFVFVFLPYLLSFFDYEETVRIGKALVAGLTSSILVGAALWILARPLYLEMVERGILYGTERAGFFTGPNGTPRVIALCMPLTFFLYERKKISRLTMTAVAAAYMIGTAMAASWSGTILIVVSLVLLGMLSLIATPQTTLIRFLEAAAAVALAFILLEVLAPGIWSENFQNRILLKMKEGDVSEYGSYETRRNLVTEAVSFIEDSPLLGFGAGNYKKHSLYNLQPHNSFLLVFAEGGVLSFAGLLLIVISGLVYILRGCLKRKSLAPGIPALAAFVIMALGFFFSNEPYGRYTIFPPLLMIFYLEKWPEGSSAGYGDPGERTAFSQRV